MKYRIFFRLFSNQRTDLIPIPDFQNLNAYCGFNKFGFALILFGNFRFKCLLSKPLIEKYFYLIQNIF